MKQSVVLLLIISGLGMPCSCLSRQFHFVNTEKNWTEAQSYCREKYTDLAATDSQEELEALMKTDHGSARHMWIAQYDKTNNSQSSLIWGWSHNDQKCRNRTKTDNIECCITVHWKGLDFYSFPYPCFSKLPFICYNGDGRRNSAGRQRLVLRVKLNISTSVNMADPAVGEAILQQMMMELDNKGITGVDLKWRKQKDGEIFHLKDYIYL